MIYEQRTLNEAIPGEWVEVTAAVVESTLRAFNNKPGAFLSLKLQDRTGTLAAIMWENGEEVAPKLVEHPVVRAKGQMQDYRGKPQLKVDALEVLPAEEVDGSLFLPALDQDTRSRLETTLEALIQSIEHPKLQELARALLMEDESPARLFRQAPAARQMHHAYLGGLLQHTVSACQMCEGLFVAHPEIDRDLLVCGTLLHDVGKVREYKWQTTIEFSTEGELMGHTVLGFEMVREAIGRLEQFPQALAMQLEHMILAHHGVREFGAPIVPKTVEALALHHIENLDAKLNQFAKLTEDAAAMGAEWSDWSRALESRIFAQAAEQRQQDE